MSMVKITIIYLIQLLLLIHFSSSVKIHILRNPVEPPKRRGEIDINDLPDSKLTKICKSILSTAQNLGNNPFQIYNLCKGKYEFFGSNDDIIIKDKPFCYENIEKFFCNIKLIEDDNPEIPDKFVEIEDFDVKLTDSSEPCSYQKLTGLVVSTIQGCLKDDKNLFEKAINNLEFKDPIKDKKKKDQGNICPSLNYETYKIQDKIEFCKKAQKKETIPLEKGGQDFEYLMIKDDEQTKCKKIIDLYNLCIDTDYILYPNSNYNRCFKKLNNIYSCNLIRPFLNSYEKEMCSNYVLPIIASDYNKGKAKDLKEYCFNFNDKLTKEYEAEILSSQTILNSYINKIKNLNDYNNKITEVSKKAILTLNNTSIISNAWMKFYPNLSLKFKLRPNVTKSEQNQLNNMREAFDKSFKFLAGLERLVKDPIYQKENFSDKINSFEESLKTVDFYFNSIHDITKAFGKLITGNGDITINNNSPNLDNQIVPDDNLSNQELLAFQNEFVEMTQYAKNYLNFIMKRVKIEEKSNSELIVNSQNNLMEISNRITKLEEKKTNLIRDILRG